MDKTAISLGFELILRFMARVNIFMAKLLPKKDQTSPKIRPYAAKKT